MSIFETIIIAIVEGLTEFLPVSSTGHMIIAQNLLGVESTEFVKAFTFIIQFCLRLHKGNSPISYLNLVRIVDRCYEFYSTCHYITPNNELNLSLKYFPT